MSDIVQGVHSITLHIRDPEQARAFYRDVLGLEEVAFNEKLRRAVFALPGSTTLLTMHVMNPGEEGREPGTVSGIVFRCADPRAACAEIARRGGTITVPPTEFETPKGKFLRAAFADPDGNEFLLSNRVD
jgi:catechol 2,3-dioxygenase-like lactoylglutathione lyase family enzyme